MHETYQPLRIYTSDEYKLRKKQDRRGFNNLPKLIVDRTHLTPFIVKRIKTNTSEAEYRTLLTFSSIKIINVYTLAEKDITENLSFMYGVRSASELEDQVYDYALYPGTSTISALNQGVYYLYFIDSASNVFYSEDFRIWFPKYSVKFEYTNSTDINDLWFYNDQYYAMQFQSITYSTADFETFKSVLNNYYNHEVIARMAKDEIFAVEIFADVTILGAVHAMQFCDTIYLTDDCGKRNRIEITEIIPNESTQGGHVNLTIRYRLADNTMTSANKNISFIGESIGTAPKVETSGVWRGRAKIYRGNKKVVR
jgi:hypothetical protein